MMANDPIASLISLLARLPGIGERTAARLAFFVLEGDAQYADALGRALSTIHDEVTRCELCGNYGAESRCAICQDPRRDASPNQNRTIYSLITTIKVGCSKAGKDKATLD